MADDKSHITLNQAILAPVNAILQAQVHSARSFLNMILQMGFPHQAVDDEGNTTMKTKDADSLYRLEFIQEKKNSEGEDTKFKVSIPTIAALPLNPLAIEEAEVEFSMNLKASYDPSKQMRDLKKTDEKDQYTNKNRPWYLIDNPVELAGTIGAQGEKDDGSQIFIKMKLDI